MLIVDKLMPYAIGLVLLVLLGAACWYGYGERKERKATQKHVVSLQADSTKKEGFILRLQKQANDALDYADRYKVSRDSAIAQSDQQTSKLTYSQKVVAYLKALVDNKTLSEPIAPTLPPPSLLSDDVVTAGLKTANREKIERDRGDSLIRSVAVRDARILALRQDKLTLKSGLVEVKSNLLRKAKGGIWPFNHRRIKEEKASAKETDDILKASELEEELNQ